jgi:pullulanase/glycogen debranching enzyme
MGRRLIIDSLSHLVETFDVDGFRFDLAELIGTRVLAEIESALKRVKPSIVLIAEPWSFRGHIALELKSTGFASWNDGYRNFLCDYVLGHGNQDGLRYFMNGSLTHLAAWPAQSVNYVESHDDRCWIDKITENPDHQGQFPTPNDRRRTHLMVAILMSSFGIPMLSAGQDFLRTKCGVHNSYRSGDINALDYHRLLAFSGSHEYFRRWIRFRLSERGALLRLGSRPSDGFVHFFGADHGSALAMLLNADYSRGQQRLLFAVNPHHTTIHIGLGDLKAADWRQLADHERFEPNGLECAFLPWSGSRLELPPLTCGLWEQD